MAFDLDQIDPAAQRRFDSLKRSQDMRLAEWRKPRGVCVSGMDDVHPPRVFSDAELMATAAREEAEFRAWYDSAEQVSERARIKALRDREEAVNRIFYGEAA